LVIRRTTDRRLTTRFPRATPFFTPTERAALAWTESVTEIARTGVPDDYDRTRAMRIG
jgi:alkylhydroperoxidase family enzyme